MLNLSSRWTVVTESEHPWEREALDFLRKCFPDSPPFRAWSNFEFLAEDGSLNEVDLLVVSPAKVFLVEIKSWPGTLRGDAGTWEVDDGSRVRLFDNPLLLTNRKCKKLKSLLKNQPALNKRWIPYFEPVVFLSSTNVRAKLQGSARTGVMLRQEHDGIPAAGDVLFCPSDAPRIDDSLSRDLSRAMDQAGIRPSGRQRRVGEYTLETLLHETDIFQDWTASHPSIRAYKRRIRIYPFAATSELSHSERLRIAKREFEALLGIHHPGVLRASEFIESERGPALVFDWDAEAQRLDQFLQENQNKLDFRTRLSLVRDMAETLAYAHSHRLFHRSLSPQVIWVSQDHGRYELRIGDWQTGKRLTDSSQPSTTDTRLHLGLFGDPSSLLYQAPEAIRGLGEDPVKRDLFSLGAIAYFILSGISPAANVQQLLDKCQAGPGLRLSEVLNGVSLPLDDLIQFSTVPQVLDRIDSTELFLERLAEVERLAVEPPETTVPPLEARPDDRLEGGYQVIMRLGKGGTSIALLVEREGKRGVLKVALSPDYNERLFREGEILRELHHQNIVELYDRVEIGGHAALFMAFAGKKTLAQRLRDEGRLSLDLLQRFGEELLLTLKWLEQNGVSHRDIKPDNIGIAEDRKGNLTLVLFDFSLSGTSVEDLHAGTPPYLDPFLRLRKPPRWDLDAERFAAAMTLYEMATGTLPIWGDGQTDPAMQQEEASLDAELFDPNFREGLEHFFSVALRRESSQRFDNAEEMLRTWNRVFEHLDHPAAPEEEGPFDWESIEDLLERGEVSENAPLSMLRLTPRLLNALDRLGAHTVKELLALPRIRLFRNQGIGQRTVKEIRRLSEILAARFAAETPTEIQEGGEDLVPSVDRLVLLLDSKRVKSDEAAIIRRFLGLDGVHFPSQQDIAETLPAPRSLVGKALATARRRWADSPWMSRLRDDLATILERFAGIMTTVELGQALLAARGSIHEDQEIRMRFSLAAISGAIETEATRQSPRFLLYRGKKKLFILLAPSSPLGADPQARAKYAEALGERADSIAKSEPILSPPRALEELQQIPQPPEDPVMSSERLVHLASTASEEAVLSSRMEFYPRGMSALRALRLGLGSLLGPKSLNEVQVIQRIASRYPDAESLPRRPKLDDLLRKAEVDLQWVDEPSDGGSPGYRPNAQASAASSLTLSRNGTASSPSAPQSPDIERAWALEERLLQTIERHRFLLLSVAPRQLLRAEGEILQRFPVLRISLESLLVRALEAESKGVGAQWPVVLRADGADSASADWSRLLILVRRVIPLLRQQLLASVRPVLLVENGLLARYQQIGLLEELREACSISKSAPGFLVLVPSDEQSAMPRLEGKSIPMIDPSEYARIPEAWLKNQHRGEED